MNMILWPTLNASLNAMSVLFLTCGYIFIKRNNRQAHKVSMLGAFLTSLIFLISYIAYHYQVGSTSFTGTGWIRSVYFSILLSHTILAVAILPLVLITLFRALKGQFDRHAKIARWTWPLWMYVSGTGVLIYFMLYHLTGSS